MNMQVEQNKRHSGVQPLERRWVLWFGIAAMALTFIPYLIGYTLQNEEWVFTGFVFAVDDANSYIAKMLSGANGDWLFRTPYTAMPQDGLFVFFPYILLGKLSSAPSQHIQLVAIYHLFRFGAGLSFFLAAYEFVSVFIRKVSLRRWATILAVLGGGLGWVLVLLGKGEWLGSIPLDFYSPESFGFLAVFGLPHLALARALMLWGLATYLQSIPPPNSKLDKSKNNFTIPIDRRGFKIGLLWLLMGFMQPLSVVVVGIVVVLHLTVLRIHLILQLRRGDQVDWAAWNAFWRRAFWAGLISSPMVLYTVYTVLVDPFMQAWTTQNIITSPHPLHYLLAYNLFLAFGFIGGRMLLQRDAQRGWLPVSWVLALPVLVYLPVGIQRRLADGVWAAIVVLAIIAFENVKSKNKSLTRMAILSIALPTTIFLLMGASITVLQPTKPLYRPAEEVAAIQFLGEYAEPDAVILASFETGNVLPAWADVRVVIGHGPESVGLAELQPRVEAFFRSTTADAERYALLGGNDVRYVFWGPEERKLGDWDPNGAGYLDLIYEEDDYAIFEVIRSARLD
ncbi:MAG: hypothetical protein FVQ83_09420 [Chloroflexi bacterium]|nr:hypothetical protein [Chloroflexota bacterium]